MEITKSESIAGIAKALIEFHKKVGVIKKAETNPFFKSKYADLPTILDAIDTPLQEAGLAYVQFPVGENQLATLLMHGETGEWIQGTYKMTPAKNDPQGQGSVITYQRRYALGAVLGLNIDEDDDGNKASGNVKTAPSVRLPRKPVVSPEKSDPDAIESVQVSIHDADSIEALQLIIRQIPVSVKLSDADKTKYVEEARKKMEEFDPTK